tara:strand:+ start:749 stop:1096 length:348 start_codon:yes stop_codon:yes gene_type:complete
VTEKMPLLDRKALDRLVLDVGLETTQMLLASLKTEIESSGRKLSEYFAVRDRRLLENQAHALKSAARSFGALQLGESCLALEEAARSSDFSKLTSLMREFQQVSAATLIEYGFDS